MSSDIVFKRYVQDHCWLICPFHTETVPSCTILGWMASAMAWLLLLLHAGTLGPFPDANPFTQTICALVFASLRMYAIWGGSLAVGISTFVLYCIPLAIRVVSDRAHSANKAYLLRTVHRYLGLDNCERGSSDRWRGDRVHFLSRSGRILKSNGKV